MRVFLQYVPCRSSTLSLLQCPCQLLAMKHYAVAINSMADERTASNFTWFNSSLRNHQQVGTLVDMIRVWQWYLAKVCIRSLVSN